MTIEVNYDLEADAAWIRIGDGQSAETVQASDTVNLDYDSGGRLLAIEVLNASMTAPSLAAIPSKNLAAAE